MARKREDCTFPIASKGIAKFGARTAPYESTADSGRPPGLQESDGERERLIDSSYNKQQNAKSVVKAIIKRNGTFQISSRKALNGTLGRTNHITESTVVA